MKEKIVGIIGGLGTGGHRGSHETGYPGYAGQ